MSFILDALKKSELERQRQTVPGLMDAGAAAPRSGFPPWAVAIALLLGVNVLILSFVLLRPSDTGKAPPRTSADASPTAPRRVTPDAAAAATAPGPTPHFSPLDAPPEYAPEIPVTNEEGAANTRPTAAMTAQRRPATDGVRQTEPVLAPHSASNSGAADVEGDEALPTISELNLTGPQALPELHLDVHVYATSAADRFVYVNMRKYREGSVLQEGPTVERIRRDGVVLNHQGLRFLLPRQ
jgi:general secretion pathway protein B